MTTILRLTGLSVKAGIEDLRTFFENLHIPDGGVYILGGSLQEAFIAFNSEKEARLALRQTGSFLRGSQVNLYLSNMQEVEDKLEFLLKTRKETPPRPAKKPRPILKMTLSSLKLPSQDGNVVTLSPSPASSVDANTANEPHLNVLDVCSNTTNGHTLDAPQIDSSTAFLLGVCTVLQGLQLSRQSETVNLLPRVDFQVNSPSLEPDLVRKPEQTVDAKPGYVRLFGLPMTTTKDDIGKFFKGLTVQEALVNVELGINHGCLVKFASDQDACEALRFNQQFLGDICVEVRGATEKMWNSVLQECTNAVIIQDASQENGVNGSENHKETSLVSHRAKRKSASQLQCNPSKIQKFDGDPRAHFSTKPEQVVMVSNLPKTMTKTEIKELFGCNDISHKNVLHLLDKDANRTDTAFIIFHRAEDYDYALNLSGCHVGAAAIEVSPISKITMRQMISKNRIQARKPFYETTLNGKHHSVESVEIDSAAQTCLFLRNMPATVQKNHITSLFKKFNVTKEGVTILHDIDGNGIGEAVVQFESASLAQKAQRIHGKGFLGSNLLLTLISTKQMEDILETHLRNK